MTADPQPVFPFFVGCERSGTTMFRLMFDSHPTITIPGESYFIAQLYQSRRLYRTAEGPFPAERFAQDIRNHRWFQRWNLPEDRVTQVLLDDPPDDYPDAIRRLFGLCAEVQGKPLYGDKTPLYVLSMPMLAGMFPESRFVHLIRDGRDVALSLRDVWFGPNDPAQAALFWERRIKAGRAAGRALGPQRYLEIHYEDLVSDPETVLSRTCAFLDLTFDPHMLDYPRRASHQIERLGMHLHSHVLEPPTRDVRSWRTQMSAEDAASFEAVAGYLLTDLGYERSAPEPSLGARARVLRVRAEERVRRRVRRLRASRVTGSGRRPPPWAPKTKAAGPAGEGPGT